MAVSKFWFVALGEKRPSMEGDSCFLLNSNSSKELELSIFNQVSFLHSLYDHHFHKNWICSWGLNFFPGSGGFFPGSGNCVNPEALLYDTDTLDYLKKMTITKAISDSFRESTARGSCLPSDNIRMFKRRIRLPIFHHMSPLQTLYGQLSHKKLTPPRGITYNPCSRALGVVSIPKVLL